MVGIGVAVTGDVRTMLSGWTEHWDSTSNSDVAEGDDVRCGCCCCCELDASETSSPEEDAADCRSDGCCCVVVDGSDGDVRSGELVEPVVVLGGSGVPAGVEERRLG